MGKPVAFEASAEERETLGFISMRTRRPERGSTANWTFEPPVSTPIARSTASASSRMSWYSRSESVCTGAPAAGGRDPPPPAAERERRPDDERVADSLSHREGVLERAGHTSARDLQPGLEHRLLERAPVL